MAVAMGGDDAPKGARAAAQGADEEELSFEQALQRLEQAVLRLESGELSLDEALAVFEEGVRMARLCGRRLEQAEARLLVLVEGERGVQAVPFQPGSPSLVQPEPPES